jgi:type I restriction enzyme S subunit
MDRPWVPAGLKWAFIRKDDPKALLVQRCARLRTKDNGLDQHFLRFVIGSPSFENYLRPITTGVNVPHISGQQILDYEFKLPPLPAQRRIANILSTYDDLIENNLRRIRILEEMARSTYRQWFVNFRFPGHEKVSLVDSALGRSPPGWEVGRLDDAFVLQRGFDLPKPMRSDGPNPVYAATGVVDFHAETKAKAPGVITGRSGTIGEIFYVQQDYWPLNTTLWVKEFRKAEPLIAYYVLSLLDLKQFNSGAAVPTLNRNDIHGLPILIPPRNLQRQFQDIAGAMLSLSHTLEHACENLRQTRDLLLTRLLSGTINVSESNSLLYGNDNEGSIEQESATQKSSPGVTKLNEELLHSRVSAVPVDTRGSAGDSIQQHSKMQSNLTGKSSPVDQTDRWYVRVVIRQAFSDGKSRTREDAIRQVPRALGYGRVRHRIQDVLHTNLLTAVRRGILQNAGEELRLFVRSIADYDRDFLKRQFLAAIGRSWTKRDNAIQNFCRWMGLHRT